jgi:hypothetical protein
VERFKEEGTRHLLTITKVYRFYRLSTGVEVSQEQHTILLNIDKMQFSAWVYLYHSRMFLASYSSIEIRETQRSKYN